MEVGGWGRRRGAQGDGKQALLLLPRSRLWQDICPPLVLAWVRCHWGDKQGLVLGVSIPVSSHLWMILAMGKETALCSC